MWQRQYIFVYRGAESSLGFKGSPHLLGKYHSSHPEMPGPPVRLEQWLRAYEGGADAPDHPDDNKPVMEAPTEVKNGGTRAKDA